MTFLAGCRRGGSKELRLDQSRDCSPPSAAVENLRAAAAAAIIVCTTCRSGEAEGPRPGLVLYEALRARLEAEPAPAIRLAAVECLSVCKRPCTVALAGPGKWTYVVGDLDPARQIEDILDAARRFAATTDGIVPWRERPLSFRKGVVSRTPPLLEGV